MDDDKLKEMYSMKLNGMLKIHKDLFVLRVPGGWIYQEWHQIRNDEWACSMCFVPEPKIEEK